MAILILREIQRFFKDDLAGGGQGEKEKRGKGEKEKGGKGDRGTGGL
jgi:hypothetical protein